MIINPDARAAEKFEKAVDFTEALKKEKRNILLYGTGNGADKISDLFCEKGIKISGIFVSDEFNRGQSFRGFKVTDYNTALQRFGDFVTVCAFGIEGGTNATLEKIKKSGAFFAPNLPVYGGGRLDLAAMKENREKIIGVYNHLADDFSRTLFSELLLYDITADPTALCEMSDGGDFPEEYYSHSDIHIDVGANTGRTVFDFAEKNRFKSKIYAVEPDGTSFERLVKAFKPYPNIACVNAAASDKNGEKAFAGNKGRGSALSENGNIKVKTVSLDGLCDRNLLFEKKNKVGSVRIDAEGEDAGVICGSANIIYEDAPKIAFALYHRAYDLFELPDLLLQNRPDFKFRLYRKPYIPAWDVFGYAFCDDKKV